MAQNGNKIIMRAALAAAFFGLAAGLVGGLVSRVYLYDSIYRVPFIGDINLTSGQPGGPSVIIQGARNVTIEQDKQAVALTAGVRDNLVGFYRKAPAAPAVSAFSPAYRLDAALGQGLAVTNDGWAISSFRPAELKDNAGEKEILAALGNYVAVDKDKQVFSLDAYARDPLTGFTFFRLSGASGLPVRNFAAWDEVKNGQTVLLANWAGESALRTVRASLSDESETRSSDEQTKRLVLDPDAGDRFAGAVVLTLDGNVAGLPDAEGRIIPAYALNAAVDSLLRLKSVKRAVLGVHYYHLPDFAAPGDNNGTNGKGALLAPAGQKPAAAKGSPAETAGLKAGDIILSVDGREITVLLDLQIIIAQLPAGREVEIEYLRQGEKASANVKLESN